MTAAVLTAAVALSQAAPAVADVGDEDVVRLRLNGVTVKDTRSVFTYVGDNWVTHLHLYTPEGKFAGDSGARCTTVGKDEHGLTAQCTRVLRMKDGEITLHDMITRKGDETVTAKTAIAGGTGVYNDAEGEGYITLEGDRVLFDLHVDD